MMLSNWPPSLVLFFYDPPSRALSLCGKESSSQYISRGAGRGLGHVVVWTGLPISDYRLGLYEVCTHLNQRMALPFRDASDLLTHHRLILPWGVEHPKS